MKAVAMVDRAVPAPDETVSVTVNGDRKRALVLDVEEQGNVVLIRLLCEGERLSAALVRPGPEGRSRP